MSNLNVVVLQGNLTADPELVGSEKNVAKFTIAVNSGFGENKETAFIDCVAFGKQVEAIKNHFAKGKQIIVRGAIRQNRWEDKDSGQKRSKLEVVLENFNGFNFTGSGGGGGGQKSEGEAAPVEAATGEPKLF